MKIESTLIISNLILFFNILFLEFNYNFCLFSKNIDTLPILKIKASYLNNLIRTYILNFFHYFLIYFTKKCSSEYY